MTTGRGDVVSPDPLPARAGWASVAVISRMGTITVTAPWRDALDAWEGWQRAAGRPDTTLYLRSYHIRRLAHAHRARDPWSLQLDDLVLWLAGHPGWAPETRRAYRASLRSFYRWAELAGHVPLSPAGLLPHVTLPRAKPRPTPEAVLSDALTAADDRARLMVMLAAHGGLRRGEIARVHSRDLGRDDDGPLLRVAGKGGHQRDVPLTGAVAAALTARGDGWAFPGRDDGHLSAERVGKIVSALMPPGWTTHTLRHRFATRMRAADVQLDVIQELLGHASVDTTRIYTAVPHRSARAAVATAA